MPGRAKLLRLLYGTILLAVLLLVSFSIIRPWLHTWGSTPEEVAQYYEGDEILNAPIVLWTHAVTIHARPEQVWPWIIQMGDVRAGYYSFTFIENMADQTHPYHNANQIVPEWQNPPIGQRMIDGLLAIKDIKSGKSLLASSTVPEVGWTWLWTIKPQGENETRLNVRVRIQVPGQPLNPVITWVLDMGGSVMELGMIHGLKDRAEGNSPPAYFEVAGIIFWILAFIEGIVAAVWFIIQRDWRLPVLIGILAVVVLLVLTFVQPALWVRLLLDLVLLTGLWWNIRKLRTHDLA